MIRDTQITFSVMCLLLGVLLCACEESGREPDGNLRISPTVDTAARSVESRVLTKSDGWKISFPDARRKIGESKERTVTISGEQLPATITRYAPEGPAFFMFDSPDNGERFDLLEGRYKISAFTEIRSNGRVFGYYLLCNRIPKPEESRPILEVSYEIHVVDEDGDGRFESLILGPS